MGGQRKKKGGRVTPKGGASARRMTPTERAGLEDIFDMILRSVPEDLTDELPPLAVEMWASQVWSIWATSVLIESDPVEVFADGFIAYAGKQATPAAVMALRALGAVVPEPYRARSGMEADRLAVAGVAERRWATAVGTGEPTVAWLTHDPIDDDGVCALVEFDGPGEPSTIGVFIDHNLGGMAKDVFAVPVRVGDVIDHMQEDFEGPGQLDFREISLQEASAHWAESLEMTDMMFHPPTSEEFDHLRALAMSRLSKLPRRRRAPVPSSMSEDERDELLAQFLESDETVGLWSVSHDDERAGTIEHLAHQILTFSLDYVRGTPLRFSPVMVEVFCLDWAPRKIAVDGDGFTLLPDMLAAWIRFVGRRRGIPEEAIAEAVDAAYDYAPEMIELSQNPAEWGPAKTIGLAMQQRGIDLTDQSALDNFLEEVNSNGGIDVLADSLAESLAPKR